MSSQDNNKRIVDDIFLLKRRCAFRIEDLCAEADISPREMAALESLQSGERVSGNELSRRMDLSPSRGSRIIDRLIRKGFLLRETDPNDRRAVLLSLSSRGLEQKGRVEALKDECERLLRSRIDETQLEQVREGMRILLKAI